MSLCSPTKEHRIDIVDPTPVRVAAVPAAHPYVRAVTANRGIAVLADPAPDPAHPDRWWPPAMLDGDWIRRAAADFDVMHVHFGMESLPAGRLVGALNALDELGKPVLTANKVTAWAGLRRLGLPLATGDQLLSSARPAAS